MYDDTPPRLSNQYYNPFYPFPTKTNRSDLQFQTVDVFLITLKKFHVDKRSLTLGGENGLTLGAENALTWG